MVDLVSPIFLLQPVNNGGCVSGAEAQCQLLAGMVGLTVKRG